MIPSRPKLTLKKPGQPAQASAPKPSVNSAPAPLPSLKSIPPVARSASPTTQAKIAAAPEKPKKKPTQQAVKALKKQENILQAAEFAARKKQEIETLQPLVAAYFVAKPIMAETVEIDGVTCLKPLAVGTGKAIFATLKVRPEFADCTNSTLNQLIAGVLHPHTSRPDYLAGVLAFDHRHTIDGEPTGEVTPKHKANATKRTNPELQQPTKS